LADFSVGGNFYFQMCKYKLSFFLIYAILIKSVLNTLHRCLESSGIFPNETLRKDLHTMSEKQKSPFPMYRGKPLVRSGDTIYYGNMTDKYVIKIDIKTKKTVEDMQVADKCTVQLMLTDPEIRSRKQIVKTSEKNGLYLALDIADAWLTRALTE
jgi:hypothetical protein